MLKLKSLFLMTLLSTGVMFGASSAFAASCACSTGQPCVCVQCDCANCN